VAALALGSSTATAQDDGAYRWYFGLRNFTAEAYVGLANHGRFLLQTLGTAVIDVDTVVIGVDTIVVDVFGVNPQRKLTAENSFSWGLAVSARVLPRTAARLAFNWTRMDLEYEDDTGIGSDLLDQDDIGDLTSTTLGLELMRFLFPEWRRFNAYGTAGVIVTWWSLDDDAFPAFVAVDDTHLRFGGSAGVGLQYRASRRFAIRLEAATLAPGNPFTGESSYVPRTGLTIDEPSHVRQTNVRVHFAYTFGRPVRGRGRWR
jgi:opacity protein-like surface antigen